MAKSAKPTTSVSKSASTAPSDELVFKKLTVNSFGGINKSNPVVIHFPDNKHIVKAMGNQGTRKTSTMNAFLFACGKEFDVKLDNFVNLDDDTISVEQEFQKKGKSYKVTASKSKFTLKKFYRDGEDSGWIDMGSPKDTLAELIGHVATSPMFLKSANGDAQIKWLYQTLKVPEDVQAKESKLKVSLDTATRTRTEANREYVRVKAALSEEPLYATWEQNEKKYAEDKSIETVQKKLEDVNKERQDYINAKTGLVNIKATIKTTEARIEAVRQELAQLEADLKKLETRKKNGEKHIEDNKGVEDRYAKAMDEFTNINNYILQRKQWGVVKQRKKEMDDFETAVQKLDVQKAQISKDLKELVKSILPPIDGLEVYTEDTIDGQKKGFKVHGKTAAQLSESELFEFYFNICMSQGVSLVVIENISSFGSSAIETLNKMSQRGVVVFATEMDRKKESLEITFVDELK